MGSNDSQSQMYGLMLTNFYHELVEKEEQLTLHTLALAALEGVLSIPHLEFKFCVLISFTPSVILSHTDHQNW